MRFHSRAVGSAGEWYLITTDAAAPYGVNWATDPWVPDGAYDLKVEAWDGSTKKATGVFTVTVAN